MNKKVTMAIFLCIGLLFGLLVGLSNATEYYEWVQNPSFEPYINYFEDYSAESNAFNSGVQYGNFSNSSTLTTFSLSESYIGLRSFKLSISTTYLWYNLTTPIIGADIINASFYHMYDLNDNDARVRVYYDDYTSNLYSEDSYDDDWTYHNFVDTIDDAKYVVAFKFYNEAVGNIGYFDNFILYDIDDNAQEYVTSNTTPWYEPIIWSVDTWQEISTAQAHTGNASYHDFIATGDEEYGYQGGVPLTQSFYGLNSDTVNDFRLYAMTDNEIDLQVMFLYSDETYSTDTKYVNASDWTLYVFNPTVSGKTIVGFRITPFSKDTYTVNMFLDDVSLTATQNYDVTPVNDEDHDGIPDNYDTYDDEDWIDDEEYEQEELTDNLINWIAIFMVIFLPAILFAGGIYENNQQPDAMHISPIFGLIAGLVLSVGIGVYTEIVPLWILLLIIVAIAILVTGMIKR